MCRVDLWRRWVRWAVTLPPTRKCTQCFPFLLSAPTTFTTWRELVVGTWVPQHRFASTPGIVTSRTCR